MKGSLLAGLIPVLISAALANNPWGGPGVCVVMDNQWSREQLASSFFKHDADRRYLGTNRGNGHSWIITKDEKYANHYKIKNKGNGEELFQSVQKPKVFTWIPKRLINDGGASWNIIRVRDGIYKLKNKKFGDCLWSAAGTVEAWKGCDQNQYYWQIFKVAC